MHRAVRWFRIPSRKPVTSSVVGSLAVLCIGFGVADLALVSPATGDVPHLPASTTTAAPTPSSTPAPVDCEVARCVTLTFDDGPGLGTAAVLDALEARHVPATFFLIGRHLEGNEAIVRRQVASGMTIGNHTWDHVALSAVSREVADDEIGRTSDALERITGIRPRYVRPPMGRFVEGVTSTGGLTRVLWNVDSRDWISKDADAVVETVLGHARPGAVILLHDIYPSTAAAIPRILDGLAERGLTPVSLEQMHIPFPPPS